ncbi:MAG: hypothetical protein WCC36_03300 [Gammaproteobacteria bacterium]
MQQHDVLSHERSLPHGQSGNSVVQWHAFRAREAAEAFIPYIQLGPGQYLVGGVTRDSVGPLWWVGVEVDDPAQWGNRLAVNKHAG